jgi:hypothetical protein
VLLNDRDPIIVIRNIVLLLLLCSRTDKTQAAELALHFWYSAFVPIQYYMCMQQILLPFLESIGQDCSISSSLGPHSSISGEITPVTSATLLAMLRARYQIGDAQNELHRIR